MTPRKSERLSEGLKNERERVRPCMRKNKIIEKRFFKWAQPGLYLFTFVPFT